MHYLTIFIYYSSLLMFLFLFLQSGYLFLFAAAGRLISLKRYSHATTTGRFVIYLFCSDEEEMISAAESLLLLSYPGEKKHIVIISRSLTPAAKMALQNLSVQWVETAYASSKTKALQTAVQQTTYECDYALLLDAKHICTKGFLYRINDALQSGCEVAHGQRIVRNTVSLFGLLDAISEGVDTHIFCKSQQLMGLSSSLTDSGAGIRFSLLRNMVAALPASGNFTKETELYLLRRDLRIAYVPKAFLYEEKKHRTARTEEKYEQWATAKSAASKAYYTTCFSELRKGNAGFLNKVFQSLLLPRILLLGITPLAVIFSFLHVPVLPTPYWVVLWLVTYAAVFMSMPARYITNRFLRAVFFLPILFINMVKMFFKTKRKRGRSLFSYTT